MTRVFSLDHKVIGLQYAEEYEIVCSQLCGLGHYKMRGILRVVAPAEFRRWIAAQRRYRSFASDESLKPEAGSPKPYFQSTSAW